MVEQKKLNGGTFKGLDLHKQLCYNIPFNKPTPIQRKVLPEILEGRSLMAIARTGSGKTLCYMIPAIQRAVEGKSSLILLPTKELVLQVKRVFKRLSYKIELRGSVEITTHRDIRPEKYSLMIVDEIDRVLEEKSLKEHFMAISEKFIGQRAYFSATLPDEPLNMHIVAIETKIPDTISHTFLYVPSESKEAALLDVLDSKKKTIIFAATRYGVDLLLAVLEKYHFRACGIYGSMDDDARTENFRRFCSGSISILVVTDVAARGLDIPFLDVSISYDMSDEKTFVHRVGRIRGVGEQFSLVTYSDVFHFFNIKETHLPDVEIGTVPQEILDRYDLGDLDNLRYAAQCGYQRCMAFRRKVSVPSEYKALVDTFTTHSRYAQQETLATQVKRLHSRKIETSKIEVKPSFRDQFFVPYARVERKTHSSAFSVMKDDYVKERKEKMRRPRFYQKPKNVTNEG